MTPSDSAIRHVEVLSGVQAEYLTASQVAELLQVSEKSVYRWAKEEPTFPVLRIAGTVRFPRERLLRWFRQREQGQGRIGKTDSPGAHSGDSGTSDYREAS